MKMRRSTKKAIIFLSQILTLSATAKKNTIESIIEKPSDHKVKSAHISHKAEIPKDFDSQKNSDQASDSKPKPIYSLGGAAETKESTADQNFNPTSDELCELSQSCHQCSWHQINENIECNDYGYIEIFSCNNLGNMRKPCKGGSIVSWFTIFIVLILALTVPSIHQFFKLRAHIEKEFIDSILKK